ncbi:MAG: lantibiotic ABC transporter permease [Candidatus Portnoybacteria bacterium RBG_13_40_8]|uniref:Lantibiotic ABC transporter permease n=1 Tax=Candidatus Portnoybacteria bacterium RBG_13_40_8 TaxID=1801990 RepID=A0A1G2F1J2_9BACT|nr:MAG: lantibiotic ABC transporter permease [Candidatus Portnoybacteria bacterium RBG_13_40_8]
MKKILNKFLVPVAYLAMVVVNYLANALPLGGRGTGVISDAYPNLFAPAGYAFSIWGLIYTLLTIYVVYQFSQKENILTAQVNRLFVVNALFNVGWLFAWHYDVIWLSVLLMIGLLVTLIKIADVLRQSVLTRKENFLVRLPFSIYFGWITVATIANITVLLVGLGWNGFGLAESFWTVIVLLVGAAIGSWRTIHDRNIPYALVLVWAYGAILFKHVSESEFNGAYPTVIVAAGLCILVFAVAIATSKHSSVV